MNPTKPLVLCAAVLLSACIQLPDIEPPMDGPIIEEPHLTVTLTEPTGTTYTQGIVSIQLQMQGDAPEQVELWVDEQPLATLQTPYRYSWSTVGVAEGTHRLVARARIGDKTFSSEAREVVVDRTSPQVVNRLPAPGAQKVWVRQPIEASFSEPLKASTVSSSSVQLTAGSLALSATLALSADGKTLTVTPVARPTVPNTLQLALTTAITDLAGNSLSLPDNAWTWSLPTLLPFGGSSAVTGNTGASTPFIHLDSQGHPFVIWREEASPGKFNVYVYRWTGAAWDAVGTALSPSLITPSFGAFAPQKLLLDSADIPVAAWVRNDGVEPGIHVVRWSGGQWVRLGEPLTASSSSQHLPQFISLQLDSNNRPYVAWDQRDQNSSSTFIHVRRWTGSEWVSIGAPLPTAYSSQWFAQPAMVLDSADRPLIVWADASSDSRFNGINVRRWTGHQWVSLGDVLKANPQPDVSAASPQIILDPSGHPIVAWSESDGLAHNLHLSRWTGTAWTPLGSALSAVAGATDTSVSQLAKDGVGNIFIMWLEEDSPDVYSSHLRRWGGSHWESLGPPITQAFSASFHVDASGTPVVTRINSYTSPPTSIVEVHRYNH